MVIERLWLDATLTDVNSKVPSRFHGMRFASRASCKFWHMDEAVKYAAASGGVLQSVAEAAAIRVDNPIGSPLEVIDVSGDQLTRTFPLYFMADGKWQVAVSDSADFADNLVLVRSAEARKEFAHGRMWTLRQSDNLVKKLLKLSEKEGRVFELPVDRQPYAVAHAAMGADSIAKGFFGDISSAYGNFLAENNHESCNFYFPTIGLQQISRGMVGVRPVRFGNDNVNASSWIGIGLKLGYARSAAVAKNFSP